MISFPKRATKTVFESISPILIISRLAGVCPLTKQKKHGKDEIKRSSFLTAIHIIILLISMAHLGFIPYAVIYIEEVI